MASRFSMVTLRWTKSGAKARKRLPEDIRLEYQALHGPLWEVKFHRPVGTPPEKAKAEFAAWLAEEAIHDMETFTKEYGPKVPATLQPYGGRFVVRGGRLAALEGDAPPRFVIIAFDSMEKARAWYNSPAYQQLAPIRQRASKTTLFIAEGVPN